MVNSIKEENILIQAGLSEDQALVYDMLLERGPQKASAISSWTGIKRGLTYKILEQLEIMGLVERKGGDGTVATFYPQHPSLLMHTLEGREKELALAKEMLTYSLGALSSKYNLITGKPSVEFYEGVSGVKRLYDDVLATGKEVLLIQSANDREVPGLEELISTQIRKQVAKGISVRAITPLVSDTKDFILNHDKANMVSRRVVKKDTYNPPAQILIYGDNVGVTSFEGSVMTTIISDKAIHDTMLQTFESLWSGFESEHNQILKSLGL